MLAVNREYPGHVIEVILDHPGEKKIYQARNGLETAQLNRVFNVFLDQEHIGEIMTVLVNRSQRSPGKMYVNRSWKAPAWIVQRGRASATKDYPSRVKAVRALIDAELAYQQREEG